MCACTHSESVLLFLCNTVSTSNRKFELFMTVIILIYAKMYLEKSATTMEEIAAAAITVAVA